MISETPQSNHVTHLRRVLQATAVVGAIFTLVFLGLLIVNGYQQHVSGTEESTELTTLKQQLLNEPDNETLIQRIREQDRDYRTNKLRQLDFSGLGSLMLLISAAITIGALKWRTHLEGINPEPCSEFEEPHKGRMLRESRFALVVLVFLCKPLQPMVKVKKMNTKSIIKCLTAVLMNCLLKGYLKDFYTVSRPTQSLPDYILHHLTYGMS